jgi:alkaline phosphatase D
MLAGLAALPWAPGCKTLRTSRVHFPADPFLLGVASGYPTPDGFSLWTRLALVPLEPDGGMEPASLDVVLEVAEDDTFRTIAHKAKVRAVPELAHSVHADLAGLRPDRWYHYRFRCGDAESPVGRTRTAPAIDAPVSRLRFAIGSCQHLEHGWYVAHRHLLDEDLDLMVFLGDYIYESAAGNDGVRRYAGGEPHTLGEYRVRHAEHRSDLDLQRLHGAVPWLLTWDDHEVDNDWAGEQGEDLDPAFLQRRAAAFQAWFEHMPVPLRKTPHGPSLTVHDSIPFGQLARFTLLDDRQHRSPQSCPKPGRGGSNVVDRAACPEVGDPARTLLGTEQERWLDETFAASRQRWNVIGQQTLMAPFDAREDDGLQLWTDGWEGYPEARRRLLASMVERKLSNPVVLGGDVHTSYVADLHLEPWDLASPVVASELTCTSLTSNGGTPESGARFHALNPHLKYANGWQRGYVAFELTPEQCVANIRVVDAKDPDSGVETAASFVIRAGAPGPVRA